MCVVWLSPSLFFVDADGPNMAEKRKRQSKKEEKLVLSAENALSGIVLFPSVTVDPAETIGQLCKRLSTGLSKTLQYKVVSKDGVTPLKHMHRAFKNLKGMPYIRLLPVPAASSYNCRACKVPLYDEMYRSRVSQTILCPEHFQDVSETKRKYWQKLDGPPAVKSVTKCESCRRPAWGDCYYVTPHGKVYCEQHAQHFSAAALKMCRRVDDDTMQEWRQLTKGMKKPESWRYCTKDDDAEFIMKQYLEAV